MRKDILLAAVLSILGGPASAGLYALKDGAGNFVDIVAAPKPVCDYAAFPGCTLTPLACSPGVVTYDGSNLIVCSPTGLSSTTMPGPLIKPLQ